MKKPAFRKYEKRAKTFARRLNEKLWLPKPNLVQVSVCFKSRFALQ